MSFFKLIFATSMFCFGVIVQTQASLIDTVVHYKDVLLSSESDKVEVIKSMCAHIDLEIVRKKLHNVSDEVFQKNAQTVMTASIEALRVVERRLIEKRMLLLKGACFIGLTMASALILSLVERYTNDEQLVEEKTHETH